MSELKNYVSILQNLPRGIELAEVESEKNDVMAITVVNGELKGSSASVKTNLFIRVQGDYAGMCYTQNTEADPKMMLLEAYENGKAAGVISDQDLFYRPKREQDTVNEVSHGNESDHCDMMQLIDVATKLEKRMRDMSQHLTYVNVTVTENLRTFGIINSLGLDESHVNRIIELEVKLTCENRTQKSLSRMVSSSAFETLNIEGLMQQVKEWIDLPENEIALDNNNMPAVLDGAVLVNIFFTGWQMFSGEAYVTKSTPFWHLVDKKVASDCVTITDKPMHSESGYYRKFDCQGVPSKEVEIINKGRLVGLMHNLRTAKALGNESSGNAGRDINLIQDRLETRVIPTNFTLVQGDDDKSALLERLEDGIYICESFDMFHSLNSASGDYAIPCIGIRYKAGKPVGLIKGITIQGNILDLLGDILAVAKDQVSVSMIMSKSFQINASSVLVRALNVTGGDKSSL